MSVSKITLALAVLLTVLTPSLASAGTELERAIAPAPPSKPARLELLGGVGFLGSPGSGGGAFTTGLRLGLGRHFAVGLDLGYGLVDAGATKEDRWWIIPTLAVVIPAGRVRFDLGAGLGLGASSGYHSWSDYAAGPFLPVWAFQLVPTLSAHARAAIALSPNVDLFGRVDGASLLLGGNGIGFRDGNRGAGLTDTTWVNLSLGFAFRLL